MRRVRFLVLAMAALAMAAAGTASAGVFSSKQVWVSISGRITNGQTGTGVGGMCVHALQKMNADSEEWYYKDVGLKATTGPSGFYSITWQESDGTSNDYYVQADAHCGGNGYWEPKTYGEVTVTAQPSGGNATGINMVTLPAGRIVGRLTDSVSQAPVSGADLYARSSDYAAEADSGGDGTFTLDGLLPGSYTVFIRASRERLLDEYFHHQSPSGGSPKALSVVAGGDTFMNETLLRSNTITGTVTVGRTGLPAVGVDVIIRGLTLVWGESHGDFGFADTTTDRNGHFSVSKFGPGSYAVCFYSPVYGVYDARCWKDKPFTYTSPDDAHSWRNATPLWITGFGTTVNIHQAVPLGPRERLPAMERTAVAR